MAWVRLKPCITILSAKSSAWQPEAIIAQLSRPDRNTSVAGFQSGQLGAAKNGDRGPDIRSGFASTKAKSEFL
ncbi:hypothetical protein GCM10023306_25930 [Novosphingobium ginsenosidimutans]